MLLLPRMTGGGGFIGDIPRGGLGEEAATLDRLLAVSGIRFSPSPICGSFIVRTRREAIGVPFTLNCAKRPLSPQFYTTIRTFSVLIRSCAKVPTACKNSLANNFGV